MHDLGLTFLLASGLTLLDALMQERVGFALGDEGYLWYGVLRTKAGERPVVDFKAYDPGRYHWCALWSRLLGPGLVALRRSTAVFQLLGLWAGLSLLGTVVDSVALLAAVGLLMTWWMQPRWKRFEHSMSLFAVAGAFLLLENPGPGLSFLAGVLVGVAAIMGRNHGLYSLGAFGGVHLLLVLRGRVSPAEGGILAACWAGGIAAGYSPMLVAWLKDRDALRAYLDRMVLVVFRRGATNLGLPVPWPWRVPRAVRRTPEGLSQYLAGWLFLLLPLFYAGVVAWSPWAPGSAAGRLTVAASVVGLFSLHHAFSRADSQHLCQVVQPFIVGAVAFGTITLGKAWPALFLAVAVLGYFTARPWVPAWQAFRSGVPHVDFVSRGERLRVSAREATLVRALEERLEEHLGPDEGFFVAPVHPGLYPTLGRASPVYNTYPVYPETEEGQERVLAELEAASVRCALIVDVALDGRDDLRYRNTHPRVWRHLESAFQAVPLVGLPPGHHLFSRRPTSQDGGPAA